MSDHVVVQASSELCLIRSIPNIQPIQLRHSSLTSLKTNQASTRNKKTSTITDIYIY